jgi:polar amino acid transport system substrate-binding protein
MTAMATATEPSLSPVVQAFLRAVHPRDSLETLTPGRLRVAVSGDVPTDYLEGGRHVGIHGEVRTRVAEILELDVEPVHMAWPEMLPALADRKIDLPGLGTAWTPERAISFRYTQPFQYFFYGVARRNSGSLVDLEELRGRTVSAEAGCFNNDELAAFLGRGVATLRATPAEIVADLLEGRCEVAVYDFPVLVRMLRDDPRAAGVEVAPFRLDPRHPLTTGRFSCHLAFRRDAPSLHMAADLALDALKRAGELDAIYRRYGFAEAELLSVVPLPASASS